MTVRMADMSWPDYEKALAGGAVVMLPVGSIEQHSHHLPLGVDRYLPAAVAEEAAQELNAVVAEPIIYGAIFVALMAVRVLEPMKRRLAG